MLTLWYVCICCVLAIIAANLGRDRRIGENTAGLLGFFFGLIGILIVVCSPVIKAAIVEKVTNDNPDDLLKWFDLKEKGVITEEEFNTKKENILNH